MRRVVRQIERLRDPACQLDAGIVSRDHAAERSLGVCLQQDLERIRVVQIDVQSGGDFTHQGILALGRDQHIHAQVTGGFQVGYSPVTAGWRNQQEARARLLITLYQAQPPPAAPQAPQVPEPPVMAKALLKMKLAPVGRST